MSRSKATNDAGPGPEPVQRLKLPHATERLAFSRDGHLLLSTTESFESHVVDLRTGETLVGETMKAGMDAMMDFARQLLSDPAALTAGAAAGDDLMHRDFGGPQLTEAGRRVAAVTTRPTGLEPFDQAAGLTNKPKFTGRRLSPDGSLFLVIDDPSLGGNLLESQPLPIRLIDARSHEVVRPLPEAKAEGALPPREFSADGRHVAVAVTEQRVGIWNVGPKTLRVRMLEGHRSRLTALALDVIGATAASADDTGRLAIWSVHDNAAVGWLAGFDPYVTGLAFVSTSHGDFVATVDAKTFGLFHARTLAPVTRLSAASLGVRSFTAVATSYDAQRIAIGAGRLALIFDTEALRGAGLTLPRDGVAEAKRPSSAEDDALCQRLIDRFAEPLLPEQGKIQAELRRLFDRLPRAATRVHVEADFGAWQSNPGLYWAAQDRKGRTLVAFPIRAGSAALQRAFEGSRAVAKTMPMPLVQRGEREAVAQVIGAAWRAAKADARRPKINAVLTGSFDFMSRPTMVDLDTGEPLDPAAHRWPR